MTRVEAVAVAHGLRSLVARALDGRRWSDARALLDTLLLSVPIGALSGLAPLPEVPGSPAHVRERVQELAISIRQSTSRAWPHDVMWRGCQ